MLALPSMELLAKPPPPCGSKKLLAKLLVIKEEGFQNKPFPGF